MYLTRFVLLLALLVTGAAHAVPVKFTYTGTVDSVSGAALGALMSVGDTATIEVITDNGSSSLLSQTWDVLDTISATFTAGSYSLTHSDGWFTSGSATGFMTDAAGTLISTDWFGIAIDLTAFDTFGPGGDLNNGSGSASNGDRFGYSPSLGTVSAWSGPAPVTGVPVPSVLGLLGAGILGLGLSGRRRA